MKNEFISSIKYAWRSKGVWWYTATMRTKARFARTTLGGFWLGLSNMLTILALAFVYGTVFKVNNFNEYIVYLGIGLVSWNSLSSSIQSAPSLFEANSTQMQNTNTKHIFYTLEEWAFQIQTFGQSFILVLLALSFFQNNLFLNLLKVGFLVGFNLIIFLYWLPLLVSLIGIRYKDFYQLIPVVLQLVFLLSPFLYTKENLGSFLWIADINPLYIIIADFRDSLIFGDLSFKRFFTLFTLNMIGLFYSIFILNKSKKILPFLV